MSTAVVIFHILAMIYRPPPLCEINKSCQIIKKCINTISVLIVYSIFNGYLLLGFRGIEDVVHRRGSCMNIKQYTTELQLYLRENKQLYYWFRKIGVLDCCARVNYLTKTIQHCLLIQALSC